VEHPVSPLSVAKLAIKGESAKKMVSFFTTLPDGSTLMFEVELLGKG